VAERLTWSGRRIAHADTEAKMRIDGRAHRCRSVEHCPLRFSSSLIGIAFVQRRYFAQHCLLMTGGGAGSVIAWIGSLDMYYCLLFK
jgi:hypothetical protein